MYPKTMIAQKMRFDIEHLQYRYQEWPDDMCGLCAIAAIELALRFRKYGYKNARAVWGYLDGEWGDHCWVELDGEIFDVTATQFGAPEIVGFLRMRPSITWNITRTVLVRTALN
jgi:hypothetical protein